MYFICLDINECDSDPCQNGATCNVQANGYTCNCTDGYTGMYCEIGIYMIVSFTSQCSFNVCILCTTVVD